MKPKTNSALTAVFITLSIFLHPPAYAADSIDKETAKTEERMRDEKKRDEHQAKDYANRVKVARLDSVWRSPRTNDIDVFQVNQAVPQSHKSIALLTFDCPAKEETQALAAFIVKAKDLGADGVYVMGFEVPSQFMHNIFSPDERRVFRANAIIYHKAKEAAVSAR